jgi:hypothetical protein
MNEVSKFYWAEHRPGSYIDLELLKKEVELYKQISLTKEVESYKRIPFTTECGNFKKIPACMIPTMWGHYGDKGKGVCIRMDISKIKFSKGLFRGSVFYKEKMDPIDCDSSDITQFIAKNKKHIFFTKTKDWKDEKEYRIVSKEDEFLDISDAISEIIITSLGMTNSDEDNGDLRNTLYSKGLRPTIEDNIKILEFCSYGMDGASLVDEEGNQIFPQKICGEVDFSE